MCGITGFIDLHPPEPPVSLCAAMVATLHHRGPDDHGVWHDADTGVAIGHARLSIVDLSSLGHQPMLSADGRWVIAYNGEVYNFAEIRGELMAAGATFRGHSDTEVILEACAAWGVEATVRRLIGMFAIALWDRAGRTLYLVRDRLGIKPLYWSCFGERMLFGSELKSLRAHTGWRPEVDREALQGFIRHAYVPAPLSIYRGVHKLPPGHILSLAPGGEPRLSRYWSLRELAVDGQAMPAFATDAEAIDALDHLLRDAVRRRMVADVPLGALLSGGIDSSVVVALMQAQSERPVKTFSIGFHEQAYDESQHAKAVARHLGTEHAELHVEPGHALALLPRLAELYDEPFADASQIPTYLVSQLTRQYVTVALSGDGGDELFAGYTRYFWASAIWRRVSRMTVPLRRAVAAALRVVSPRIWNCMFSLFPRDYRPSHPGDKLCKLAALIDQPSADAVYRSLVSQWQAPETEVIGGSEPATPLWDTSLREDFPVLPTRMQYIDTVTYLPDDILTKIDRASMAVALEARVPLLDHRVVEFAWHQPLGRKIRGGQGKWLLRQVLDRYVPRALIERPKMGFGVPIDAWLRGPLRDWAETLLDERRLRVEGYFDPAPVRRMWAEHLGGTRNRQYALWCVLMFQQWLECWKA